MCPPGHGGRTRGAPCVPHHAMHRQHRGRMKLAVCWSSALQTVWKAISHAAPAGCSCPGALCALRTPSQACLRPWKVTWMLSPPPLSARHVCSLVAMQWGCISAEHLHPPVLKPSSKWIRDPWKVWTESGVKPWHQQPRPQEESRTSHGPGSSDKRTEGIFLGKTAGHGLILVEGPSQRDASQAGGTLAGTGAGWPEVCWWGKPPPSTGSDAQKALTCPSGACPHIC